MAAYNSEKGLEEPEDKASIDDRADFWGFIGPSFFRANVNSVPVDIDEEGPCFAEGGLPLLLRAIVVHFGTSLNRERMGKPRLG
jgi:hypothetical protein